MLWYIFTILGVTVFQSNRIYKNLLENFFAHSANKDRLMRIPMLHNLSRVYKHLKWLRVNVHPFVEVQQKVKIIFPWITLLLTL